MKKFEIDIANQIDNPWDRDTVIALVKSDFKFAIKLKASEKGILRKKFIVKEKTKANMKHNKKVVVMIYSYLIYKCLIKNKEHLDNILICRDYRPERSVNSNIQKISSYLGYPNLLKEINIDFRKRPFKDGIKIRIAKSKAHKYAKNILKKRKDKYYALTRKELNELIDVISKFI